MKIIRINKGKAINLPLRFVSVALIVVITVKLMNAIAEPWSIFMSIAIASLLPAIWFASNMIIINEENKTLFDGVITMGKKIGKPIQYGSIEKIFINKVKTKQTVYSLANQKSIVANHEYRAYLKLNNGTKYFLINHPLEERVKEKVTKITKKLGLSFS